MLDIAVIAFLVWIIRAIARAKRRDPVGYQVLVCVLAVAGEIIAITWGLIACDGKLDANYVPLVLAAFAGIAIGALPAFLLIAVLPPRPCPEPFRPRATRPTLRNHASRPALRRIKPAQDDADLDLLLRCAEEERAQADRGTAPYAPPSTAFRTSPRRGRS